MVEIGHFSLFLAWIVSLFAVGAGVYAGRRHTLSWTTSSARATLVAALAGLVSLGALADAFLQNDYSLQYVWRFSNRAMAPIYKISAIWGGMDGSMLLWAAILACMGAVVAARYQRYPSRLIPWVLAVFNTSSLFFFTVVLFLTNPFRYLQSPFIPPDGNGLNPLLQNPLMAIHPPMLYLGFTSFAIPCAFCLGALLAGDPSNRWVHYTRRWTLIAWGFLTAGIVLGGHWAYLELGWGGFWAWDPVENSSFLPWLTGTALLHSVMVQERKGMLKMWNVSLAILTYGLTVFGTFLTRSGVVQSVHAFASTDVGWVFLLYLGVLAVGSVILIWNRRALLRPDRHIESALSREAVFLVNNLLFLSICFATLWGVMFPVFSEALTGVRQAVGIPFFNMVNVPLFLLLLLLMGIGPLISWRRSSLASLRKTFTVPFLFSFVLGIVCVWGGALSFYPTLSYSLCFFVFLTILGEVHRGVRQQKVSAEARGNLVVRSARLFRRHRRRYAGLLIHLGVVVAAIGITASMAHKTEKEFSLAQGEKIEIGRFVLTLDKLKNFSLENYDALVAEVSVRDRKTGSMLGILPPELRHYRRNKENTTEVALRTGLREDLYLVIAGLDETGTRAAMKLFINPLQVWLWIGVVIMGLGLLVILVPASLFSALRISEQAAVSTQES